MDTRRTNEGYRNLEFRHLSPQEIDHHMRRAMQIRAEVGAEIVDAAVRGIARLGRALVAALPRPRHRDPRPDGHDRPAPHAGG